MTLDFLNKNMYRCYPLRGSSNMTFIDGTTMPLGLITSIRISAPYDFRSLYISKVYSKGNLISVTLRDFNTDVAVGCFSGILTESFSTVNLTPYISTVSGSLTIGRIEELDTNPGTHYFFDGETGDKNMGLLEDSTIFCFTPPAVTAITHESETMTGLLTTSVSRIMRQDVVSPEISLSVFDTTTILTNADFSGVLDNCPTPIIRKLNSVSPDVNGNIDIYGIVPIDISVASGVLGIDSNLTILDVCPEKNKISPPENISDAYYGNLLEIDLPEWRTWPRFNP